jgi:hypothetical protein
MFEGWQDYFLLVGSAAAALIGLLFVVVTLTAGRERSMLELGQRYYMSPIVADLAAILVMSGAAMVPDVRPLALGLFVAAAGLVGLAADVRIAWGIGRLSIPGENMAFDRSWYGIVPAIVSLLTAGAGVAILQGTSWGPPALAAVLMALLLVCVHNAWDLVTYIAPQAGPPPAQNTKDAE